MKGLSIIILALSLVLLCASAALGRPYHQEAPRIDTWYTVEDEDPYLAVRFDDFLLYNSLSGEYFRNDFFFINGEFRDDDYNGLTASYIFDCGFFIALAIWDDPWDTYYSLSPGYRWSWGDRGYLAFSLDYDLDYGVDSYDVDLRYRAEDLLIEGELELDDDLEDYELEANLAYRINEALTVGCYVEIEDGSTDDLEAGATWKHGAWVFDFRVGDDEYYEISGVYYFGRFGLGLEYYIDQYQKSYALKAKYETDDSRFTLFFVPEQDDAAQSYEIGYTMIF